MPFALPRVEAFLVPSADPTPTPAARINYAPQPIPKNGTAVAGAVQYSQATSETGTANYLAGQTDGPDTPHGRLTGYARWTVATTKTGTGESGWRCLTVSRRPRVPVSVGSTITVSLYARNSNHAAITHTLRVIPYVGTTPLAAITKTVNLGGPNRAWTRVDVSFRVTEEVTAVGWEFTYTLPAMVVGATFDLTGVLVEVGPLAPYIDGDTPTYDAGGFTWNNTWNDTPGHSSSTSTPIPVPPPPATELPVVAFSAALDRRWSPYCQAKLEVSGNVAPAANPARSDPPRVVVDAALDYRDALPLAHLSALWASATLADLSTAYAGMGLGDLTELYSTPYTPGVSEPQPASRRFDLGVRDAEFSTETMTTVLDLASDEALAQDFRLVSTSPRTLAGPAWAPSSGNAIISVALGMAGMPWAGFWGVNGPSVNRDFDVLPEDRTWEPGVSLWDYLSGVVTPWNRRVWCDERRLWTGDIASNPNKQPSTHRVIPYTSRVRRTRESEEWADAVVVKFTWVDPLGEERYRYLTAGPSTANRARYVEVTRQPSQSYANRLLDSALNSESWAGAELDCVPVLGVTPGDTLDFGDYSLECLAVEWAFPDNTMKVKC